MNTAFLRRPTAVGTAVLMTLTALMASLALTPQAHADESNGKLELVLDSSGSMKEPAEGGQSKIEAAKSALHNVVDGIPDGDHVGMRVYGATVFSKDDAGACTDSQQVVEIGPVDKSNLHREIDKYKPYGETPIAYSLKQAAKDLGSEGKRSIVLVSDGEETCVPDPCVIARDIAGQGIDLTIDVVGLDVSGKARSQLQCIADAGHGTYYDAQDAEDLEASLGKLSTRAFRDFQVDGEPIEGSKSPDAASPIEAGRYATTIDARGGSPEYFALSKTPGSTLWAAITARPPRADEGRQELAIQISDPSGQCETQGNNYSTADALRPVFVAETIVDPQRSESAACADADQVLVAIAGQGATGAGGGWNAELTIVEEPPVEDTNGLPAAQPLVRSFDSSWTGSDSTEKVVGGTSFNDAPTLDEGEYADTIVPGERLLYRVPAEFGQRVVADVYFPKTDPRTSQELPELTGDARGLAVLGQLFGPGFGSLTREGNELGVRKTVQGLEGTAMALQTPEIRYMNRTAANAYRASSSGYYYIEVDAQEDDGQTYTVPFQLRVQVEGESSGAPTDADQHWIDPTGQADSEPTAAATQTAATDPAAPDDDQTTGDPEVTDDVETTAADGGGISGTTIAWAASVVLLIAGGVLAGMFIRRRS